MVNLSPNRSNGPNIVGLSAEDVVPEVTHQNANQVSLVEAWVAASSSPVGDTGTSNSPVNGFTSEECADILKEELDNLHGEQSPQTKKSQYYHSKVSGESDAIRNTKVDVEIETRDSKMVEVDRHLEDEQEQWTLLDCCFGLPLFDAEANSQICEAIVSTELWRRESLEKLMASSRRLCLRLLDFIDCNQVRQSAVVNEGHMATPPVFFGILLPALPMYFWPLFPSCFFWYIFFYCPLLLIFPFQFIRLGKLCWHPCLMCVCTTASIMFPISM
jgi:hypothetical protein